MHICTDTAAQTLSHLNQLVKNIYAVSLHGAAHDGAHHGGIAPEGFCTATHVDQVVHTSTDPGSGRTGGFLAFQTTNTRSQVLAVLRSHT